MLRIFIKYLKDIIKGGMDLFFPPLCFNCNEKLADNEKVICDNCWSKIPKITEEILSNKEKGKFIDSLFSLWLFDDNFQNIVHLLKYKNCQSLGLKIGRFMGHYINENLQLNSSECVIVPVPLHPIKKRERGYNQSELIGKGISEITGIPVHLDLVKRVKNTATQTKMNKKERIENMHEAFMLKNKFDANVAIIVDDVYTTGTTINCVADALKSQTNSLNVIAFSAAMPES